MIRRSATWRSHSTPQPWHTGVVFDIDPTDRAALDAAEGCGRGYHRETLEVVHAGQLLRPFAYVADTEAIESSLLPYTWYRDQVVAGAKEHGLPADYVAALAGVPAIVDPDPDRDAGARSTIPPEWRV